MRSLPARPGPKSTRSSVRGSNGRRVPGTQVQHGVRWLERASNPMHVHIVMDRSSETRHEFDPKLLRAEDRFRELTAWGLARRPQEPRAHKSATPGSMVGYPMITLRCQFREAERGSPGL